MRHGSMDGVLVVDVVLHLRLLRWSYGTSVLRRRDRGDNGALTGAFSLWPLRGFFFFFFCRVRVLEVLGCMNSASRLEASDTGELGRGV